mgnify:CR=1 FL=1|tara:strand:+ start:478 stop:693 length:216 start_codon:yes stop_codon:yes gene_type:complete
MKNLNLIKKIEKKLNINKQKYTKSDSLEKIKILMNIEKKLKVKLSEIEINKIFKGNYENFFKNLISISTKK